MGLIKLALIGGVAFWAGKQYNQKHPEGTSASRCHRRSNSHGPQDRTQIPPYYDQHQQQQQPNQQYQQYPSPNEKRDDVRMVKYSDAVRMDNANEEPPVYGYRRSDMQYSQQPAMMGYDGRRAMSEQHLYK